MQNTDDNNDNAVRTRHSELEYFSGADAAIQKIHAGKVTVDRAFTLFDLKVVRLQTGRDLFGVFDADGVQVETLRADCFETHSALREKLEELNELYGEETEESEESA